MTFEEENNILLKELLDKRFFSIWKDKDLLFNNYDIGLNSNLEIFLTSNCNQKCEYCYLQYTNGELYPKEYENEETILKNLDILFNWLGKNNYYINILDLFSGEIWHTNFGIKVLEKIYEAVQKNLHIKNIMIATNGSFVSNPTIANKIQKLIEDFRNLNIRLTFSFSIDGKIVDNISRPRNTTPYTDSFYIKLFEFAVLNGYYFHPMIAASNIKYWKENFDWWKNMAERYRYDILETLMLLEVRNDNWTDEALEYYKEFLKYLYEYFKSFSTDIKDFTKNFFFFPERNKELNVQAYWPIFPIESNTHKTCSIATHLTIRAGDLAIIPCHRTGYDKLVYGYFKVENNEITDIIANNIQMAIRVLYTNDLLASPRCDICKYSPYCMRGCFGSQYEINHDPFFVNETVCKLFKVRIHTIIDLLRKDGIIDILKEVQSTHPMYERIKKHLDFMEDLEKNE